CRKPNLEKKYIDKISSIIKRKFSDEISTESQNFSPIDILNYVYAVLHSRIYREKYNNFLKIDFPRVPYPKDQNTFGQLVGLGNQLRKLHLMEDSTLKAIFQYPESGDNIVEKHVYKDGNVYINDEQYFANVPEVAWNFYIGGYQPAQKWLKDRKGQALQFEDIKHYQKMIATLQRTSEIMEEIDQIDFM
ncbi:DNA methyltransferase, partial [Acinetobacter baumannii]|nr:DNA methyltransferase [Acinetobacter baumannii]EHU2221224.1 DNA methyltransferase [Acinetobacter baumannii]EHU2392240.1 DNA methyltransferase [Acinetobacter baumannii]EHU2599996.1 DNA methyltransferase [Acinetobacter baumannii]EHU2788650.1 DNA methyltransferase [Acinetobacter baumannii]